MKSENIVLWMKKYDFLKCISWIQAIAIHPNNQLYQMRFEYLIGCSLTIKNTEYRKRTLTYSAFKNFIHAFFKSSSNDFRLIEDFKPFSQLDLIPYFFNGHKYYFFYGNLERPWEFVSKLDYMYLKPKYQNENSIEHWFIESMTFQTVLLEALTADDESYETSEGLYIPSEEYLDKFGKFFIDRSSSDELDSVIPGDFTLDFVDNNRTQIYNSFNALFINIPDVSIYVLPQLHIEILYKIFNNELFEGSFMKENLRTTNHVHKAMLTKRCLSFFGKNSLVDFVDINKESLLKQNEVAVRVEEDQVIVFHILRTRHKTDFNMETGILNVKQRVEFIKKNSFLVSDEANKTAVIAPSEVLSIQGVIIFQYTGISTLPFGINDLSIPIFAFDDIIRIFELLDFPYEFIDYMAESRELHERARIIKTDNLDEFATYLENNKSFLEAGKYPTYIMIASHYWHDHYMAHLFREYSENIEIHEFLESFKPYYFDYIEKISDNTYEVFNKADLRGGTVILFDSKSYFINSAITGNQNHMRISEKFLKPLLCEYLTHLNAALDKLIFKYLADTMPIIIYINLLPYEVISHDKLSFLLKELTVVSADNPVHFAVRWRKEKEPHIFVLFDAENMHNLFSNAMNIGERAVVNKFVLALLKYFINLDDPRVQDIANDFVESNIPIDRRRYGVEAKSVNNPRLSNYQSYIKTSHTYLSKIRRIIAEHIASMNFLPGEYSGEEAKKIIHSIYKILQGKLETTISTFNSSILHYAYTQLEYIEGESEHSRKKAEIDSRTKTDFDVVHKYTENNSELSLYTMAVKHIITSIIKLNPQAGGPITSIEWRSILAIAYQIIEITQTYEYIEYALMEYAITISELYEIQEPTNSIIFNAQEYAYQVNQKLLSNSTESEEQEDVSAIDKAFCGSFGFTFHEMITILYALGSNDFEHKLDYPLNIMKVDDLSRLLVEFYPDMSVNIITKIIEFLTLTTATYDADSVLIPSVLMRKKERLNLCPLIKMTGDVIWGNQMCISSSNFWSGTVKSGDFPYSIGCPKEIIEVIKAIHRRKDKELEKRFAKIAQKTIGHKYVISPLLKYDSIHNKLPRHPDCGEIDLLAVLLSAKKIIIGEAKNRNKSIRAYNIQLEHRDFFEEERGYYSKLMKKAAYVNSNLNYFLEHFSIQDKENWIVEPVFLVNKVYTAAFLGRDVKFIMEDNFRQYLIDEMK